MKDYYSDKFLRVVKWGIVSSFPYIFLANPEYCLSYYLSKYFCQATACSVYDDYGIGI